MATDIGFQIKLTPKNGTLEDRNLEEISAACEHAKSDCDLKGLHGSYWFKMKPGAKHVSIELYGYYTGDEEDPVEALENVLEMTWQDEENAPLIVERYFKALSSDYDIEVVRDFWNA